MKFLLLLVDRTLQVVIGSFHLWGLYLVIAEVGCTLFAQQLVTASVLTHGSFNRRLDISHQWTPDHCESVIDKCLGYPITDITVQSCIPQRQAH